MKITETDERFPIWEALSEFFLDTELEYKDYDRISTILAKSEYSLLELEDILQFEVYPACIGNLFCIAGEWAGFHPDWIIDTIGPRKDKRPKWRIGPIFKWYYKKHWQEVLKLIENKRKI